MTLALAKRDEGLDRDRLFEQAASRWLEMLDNEARPPKISRVIDAVCEAHPAYDLETVSYNLQSQDFDTYLQGRRKQHLIGRTAAKLVAAEMGARVGVRALDEIQVKLENGELTAKELIEVAKLGMNLNADIDKDLTEVTGDAKVTIEMKNVLIGLPPERAAAIMGEYGRMVASPKGRGEVIDASDSE
ncbi:MAG: hypothetical protein PHQ43_14260 [Dehalococcoidales bacterium]|jgi:hypothetical protein|nr:hypothetical protein [Dehalococcoidales bacterium]